MIKYVIWAKKNPIAKSVKYYPRIAPTTPVTLAQIVKRIEKRSTVSSADVEVVLDVLQYEVIEALQKGNRVRLGDLCSSPSEFKANGSATSDKAIRTGVNGINVQFTKSVAMRDALSPSGVEFGLREDISND